MKCGTVYCQCPITCKLVCEAHAEKVVLSCNKQCQSGSGYSCAFSPPEAYVSLVTNDSYGMGVICLGRSLRDVCTSRKLALLITNNVSAEMR